MNSNFYGYVAVENTVQEQENLQAINTYNIKTNIINTNSINPQSNEEYLSLNDVKEKFKLKNFTKKEQSILKDVIERLYYTDTLKVGSVVITNPKILAKLHLINKNNLIQLLDIVNNSSNIKNITNYLIICLYTNLGNGNIKLPNKTAKPTHEYERKYPDGFFNSLYANFPYENAVESS